MVCFWWACMWVSDVMNPSWDHCFLHHCHQQRMWNETMWQCLLYFKPSWSWRRQMDPVATVNLMCFASASIMFLLIRVVRVLESVTAGIYPEPVSSPSQDTHTYTHTYIMTLTARGYNMQSLQRELKMAADARKHQSLHDSFKIC